MILRSTDTESARLSGDNTDDSAYTCVISYRCRCWGPRGKVAGKELCAKPSNKSRHRVDSLKIRSGVLHYNAAHNVVACLDMLCPRYLLNITSENPEALDLMHLIIDVTPSSINYVIIPISMLKVHWYWCEMGGFKRYLFLLHPPSVLGKR